MATASVALVSMTSRPRPDAADRRSQPARHRPNRLRSKPRPVVRVREVVDPRVDHRHAAINQSSSPARGRLVVFADDERLTVERAVREVPAGRRRIAAALGISEDTVRGWLCRFASAAERVREFFTRLAADSPQVVPGNAGSGGSGQVSLRTSAWSSIVITAWATSLLSPASASIRVKLSVSLSRRIAASRRRSTITSGTPSFSLIASA
jgi:hypothetical protein